MSTTTFAGDHRAQRIAATLRDEFGDDAPGIVHAYWTDPETQQKLSSRLSERKLTRAYYLILLHLFDSADCKPQQRFEEWIMENGLQLRLNHRHATH